MVVETEINTYMSSINQAILKYQLCLVQELLLS